MQGEVWVAWLGRGHVVFVGREGERKEGGCKKGNEEGYEGVEMWTPLHQYSGTAL